MQAGRSLAPAAPPLSPRPQPGAACEQSATADSQQAYELIAGCIAQVSHGLRSGGWPLCVPPSTDQVEGVLACWTGPQPQGQTQTETPAQSGAPSVCPGLCHAFLCALTHVHLQEEEATHLQGHAAQRQVCVPYTILS